MELNDYLAVLGRRRSVLLRTFVLTLVLVMVGAFFLPTRYTASSVLRLETISSGSVDWLNYELEYTDRLMNTYVEIADSGALKDELAARLGEGATPNVSANILTATELLRVSARADTAEAATETANAFAQLLIEQEAEDAGGGRDNVSSSIERQLTALGTQIATLEADASPPSLNDSRRLELLNERYDTLIERLESSQVSAALRQPPALQLVSQASVEDASASTNPFILLIPLGLVLGLVSGVGLAFLTENLDPTLYARDQIEKLSQAPIVATMPNRGRAQKGLVDSAEDANVFRKLLENVSLLGSADLPGKVLAFSSAESQAGKSTIVANLGYVAAMSGHRVLIIDANLAAPTMHAIYHLNNDEGFANLVDDTPLRSKSLIQATQVPTLSVLTSGSQKLMRTPFGTGRQLERLAKLREHYDLLLLDCPPVLDVGSTLSLAKHCDALLLVVARGRTQREDLTLARQRLDLAQIQAGGIVLNYVGKS